MANMEKNLSALQEHLEPTENVLATVYGLYETKLMGQDSVRSGIFAATNLKVIFFAKKLGGYDLESFPYRSISSVDSSKGMTGFKITIYTSGNQQAMRQISKGQVPEFVSIVRDRMGKDPSPIGVADELSKLASLKDGGLISEEEWERATSLYLGKPASAREEALAQLRSLHSLHRDGVLSQSEFNSKKWDILARNQ